MYLCNIMFCIQWVVNEEKKKLSILTNINQILRLATRNETIIIIIINFIAFDERKQTST